MLKIKFRDYLIQTDLYLQQAEDELKKGDLRQAGEKYWGAATQIFKAYCELKGWPHDGHALLFKDVGNLCKELDNRRLMEQFCLASTLHTNFYEGWLTKEEVENNAEQTKKFILKIKTLIEKEEKVK